MSNKNRSSNEVSPILVKTDTQKFIYRANCISNHRGMSCETKHRGKSLQAERLSQKLNLKKLQNNHNYVSRNEQAINFFSWKKRKWSTGLKKSLYLNAC